MRELRWTVLHLYNALRGQSEADEVAGADLGRPGRPLFRRRTLQKEVGVEAARADCRASRPRSRLGLTVAGGTDAHRVSSYNPFVSLQWYLDGTTIGGVQDPRATTEAPSRRQALEMYTRNSAFMANDDDRRGTLEPGKFADLAVLSPDYLTAPVSEIGKIRSVLTMVGGKVVYAARAVCKCRGRSRRKLVIASASEAIQSQGLDCFGAHAPRNDGNGKDGRAPDAYQYARTPPGGRPAAIAGRACRPSLPSVVNALAWVNGSR